MAALLKVRKQPLVEAGQSSGKAGGDDMTVEQFLEAQCEAIIEDLKAHSAALVDRLRLEYADGVKSITGMMASTSEERRRRLCVTLKVGTGAHLGQKFRLEPGTDSGEDVFKIGRSTGKAFKEKGVSLYKDKEISTSHAKIDIRNGQAFFIDTKSTNGSSLNGVDVEPDVPIRLKSGDVISIGGSELHVTVAEQDDDGDDVVDGDGGGGDENFASV